MKYIELERKWCSTVCNRIISNDNNITKWGETPRWYCDSPNLNSCHCTTNLKDEKSRRQENLYMKKKKYLNPTQRWSHNCSIQNTARTIKWSVWHWDGKTRSTSHIHSGKLNAYNRYFKVLKSTTHAQSDTYIHTQTDSKRVGRLMMPRSCPRLASQWPFPILMLHKGLD